MTREELTKEARKLLTLNNNIAIQAGTGVGKSKIALTLASDLIAKYKKPLRILLVVAEVPHKENWRAEQIKWNFSFEMTMICYASLKKYVDTEWDLIIYDEAHHLDSTLRLSIFPQVSSTYKLFLSATLKDTLIEKLQCSCGHIESIKVGLQEAIDSNILPEPKIILVQLTLDNVKVNRTIVEEWGKKEKRVKLECNYRDRWKYLRAKKTIPNATLLIHCTEQQEYDYISEKFEYFKKKYFSVRNEAIKNKWLQCGTIRKKMLGNLKSNIAIKILKKLKNRRYICFCTSIDQAIKLGGNNAIHSKRKDSLEVIDKFNSKQISNLYAVGMLQEGQNLTDIEVGVIIQLDGEERSFIQRFGRTLRADSPVQYILYYKNTRDEEYLENALEGIDKKYIKYMTL